jgi:IPT/TIG domain/CARDB
MRLLTLDTKLFVLLPILFFAMCISSCKDDGDTTPSLAITDFSPESGGEGTTVVINGTGFATAGNEVKFNGTTAMVISATPTQLTTTVPAGATSGKISVTTNGVTVVSNKDFIISDPTITSFSPSEGMAGTSVTITGANFNNVPGNNVVQFNGSTAVVSAATESQLTVVVPAEATTGKIKVIVGGKETTSASNFTVLTTTITDFSPTIGAASTTVIINGSNFSTQLENNIVKFNGVAAQVTAATANKLTVKVPSGATTGKITVKVGSSTAISSGDFEICTGAIELIISNVEISNINGSGTSFNLSFTVTNVGSATADLTKFAIQNYVSTNDVYNVGDYAAGGFVMVNGGVLATGESYNVVWTSTIESPGTVTSNPYLIILMFDTTTSIAECNTDNNTVAKRIQ